jgi:drug/metabolite transporter (DMT)-like permease
LRVSILSTRALTGLSLWRSLSEAMCGFCMVQTLAVIPISTAAAILQATPLVVTLGAALFLGETVGWRRWTAIFVGLIGVLIILRPGTAGFDIMALWGVVTVVFLAARDLLTRQVPRDIHSLQLAGWGFLALIPAGLAHLPFGDPPIWPEGRQLWILAGALVIGPIGYFTIVIATRIGEASAVAPYRYTRLVFAMIAGAVAFGERPDAAMLIGAAIVTGSGIYTFAREARLRKAERLRGLHVPGI